MSISQRLLDGPAEPEQGERKFLLDAGTARTVWRVICGRLEAQPRDPARPITFHRTTYFDTPEFEYYRDNGPISRRVRVREYATAAHLGDPPIVAPVCFLELKQSVDGTRTKHRLALTARDVPSRLAQLDSPKLLPCLTTWYRRAALSDGGERLRVTLDSWLCYAPPLPIGGPCTSAPPAFARGPEFVLEVKSWDELPVWLVLLLRGLCEASSFTKFGAGMRAAQACGLLGQPRPPSSHVPASAR